VPSNIGTFAFTVTASNYFFGTASRTYTIAIAPGLSVPQPAPRPALLGKPYHFTFSAPHATFAIAQGALPPGLKLTLAGNIVGDPTGAGSYAFTITATGTGNATSSRQFTLKVLPAFLGFLTPRPHSVHARHRSIRVMFRLGAYNGARIPSSFAAKLPVHVTLIYRHHVISVAKCRYSATTREFACYLKQPDQPAHTKRHYYITAYERVGATFARIPPGKHSSTLNPEAIYVR
jgi:hypothetical protein